jgi:hypothetical protein
MEHFCPKCKDIILVRCISPVEGKRELLIYKPPIKWRESQNKVDSAIPYVCNNCGYIEWYVANPSKFK